MKLYALLGCAFPFVDGAQIHLSSPGSVANGIERMRETKSGPKQELSAATFQVASLLKAETRNPCAINIHISGHARYRDSK